LCRDTAAFAPFIDAVVADFWDRNGQKFSPKRVKGCEEFWEALRASPSPAGGVRPPFSRARAQLRGREFQMSLVAVGFTARALWERGGKEMRGGERPVVL
jgi:hypothetical protein